MKNIADRRFIAHCGELWHVAQRIYRQAAARAPLSHQTIPPSGVRTSRASVVLSLARAHNSVLVRFFCELRRGARIARALLVLCGVWHITCCGSCARSIDAPLATRNPSMTWAARGSAFSVGIGAAYISSVRRHVTIMATCAPWRAPRASGYLGAACAGFRRPVLSALAWRDILLCPSAVVRATWRARSA